MFNDKIMFLPTLCHMIYHVGKNQNQTNKNESNEKQSKTDLPGHDCIKAKKSKSFELCPIHIFRVTVLNSAKAFSAG